MQKVRFQNLPKPGCLVYSNVATDVYELGLEASARTKESEDVSLRKPSTDIIFVMVNTVFVETARGPPVG